MKDPYTFRMGAARVDRMNRLADTYHVDPGEILRALVDAYLDEADKCGGPPAFPLSVIATAELEQLRNAPPARKAPTKRK